MFSNIDFDKFLFFDIETVPEYETFEELEANNPKKADIWKKKQHVTIIDKYSDLKRSSYSETYWNKAAIYAEFNKIVCITLGSAGEKTQPQTISFYGTDEKEIIQQAVRVIDNLVNPVTRSDTRLWGYYSNRFDVPQVYKKILIYQIPLPGCFTFYYLKPWETQCKDVYDLWNVMMGERGGSLDLVSTLFGLESPKKEMDGSMVKDFFYKTEYKKIAEYCNNDVITTINLVKYMSRLPIINKNDFNSNFKEIVLL